MVRLFNKSEKESFSYPIITERRQSSSKVIWVIGPVLVLILVFVVPALF